MNDNAQKILDMQREYPIRLTARDGTQSIVYLYALTEQFAIRLFDEMFMSIHGTGKLLPIDSAEPIADERREVVRMELLDYLSDVVLADYGVSGSEV